MDTLIQDLRFGCLNLANMLRARGMARRKEIAIRLAIGSGPQIVRQLLIEGFVIALTAPPDSLWDCGRSASRSGRPRG